MRWGTVGGVVAVVAVVGAGGIWLADDGGGGGAGGDAGVFDFEGVRFDVPEGFVVQDIAGRVDGQLSCPDVDGFVFTEGSDREFYTAATCDPPGGETIVYMWLTDRLMEPHEPGPVEKSAGGLEYIPELNEPRGVKFIESSVYIRVHGPNSDVILDEIAASAESSPDEGLVPPTTAAAVTETSDRLADELGCETREVRSTYSRFGNAPFLGQQAEAPVDCTVGDHGFRILVFSDDRGLEAAQSYYPDVWLLIGENWALTAMNEGAANWAEERVGGTLRPPPGVCCGPPVSDGLPGYTPTTIPG